MKNNKPHIEEKVRLTMEELDELKAVEVSPFFISRLSQKLSESNETQQSVYDRFFSFGLLRPAVLVLLIALNLFSIIKFFNSTSSMKTKQQNMMDSIAESYASTTSVESIYYINPE